MKSYDFWDEDNVKKRDEDEGKRRNKNKGKKWDKTKGKRSDKESLFQQGFLAELLDELALREKLNNFWLDYGKQIKKLVFLALLIVVVFIAFAIKNEGADAVKAEASEKNTTEEASQSSTGSIFVDIGGEVKEPMLAELPEGSRVEDAINAAGGISDKADMTSINRAEFLEDGQKIYIPAKLDASNAEASAVLGTAGSAGATGGLANGKVNINTADSNALQTLNGVGPATAQKIIDYRTSSGRFSKIEDLKKVSGIGDKTFDKLKDFICV